MKKIVKKVFYNKTLPVLSGSLRGVKLRMNNLVQGSVFLRNYEPDKQQAFLFLVKPGITFFDVGANVGLHSYFVTRHFPSVKIVSFEPLPGNADYLRESIKQNSFSNITVVQAAVGATAGETYFDENVTNWQGSITTQQTNLKVKLITLDEFTSQNNIYPHVVKVDVEGAESDVLKGAKELITRHTPSFIIELHNPEQDIEVAAILLRHGYTVFRLNPQARKKGDPVILPIAKLNASWPDPDGVWGNIIAIHSTKLKDFGL